MSLYDVKCTTLLPAKLNGINTSVSPKQVLSSQSCSQDIAVALNDQLLLVIDSEPVNDASITLECRVNALCWSCDGKYLAVVDSMGYLHIVSRQGFRVAYSERIVTSNLTEVQNETEQCCFSTVVFTSKEKGKYNIAAAVLDGNVLIFEISITLQGQVNKVTKSISTTKIHEDKLCGLVSYCNKFKTIYFTLGFGTKVIACWESDDTMLSCINTNSSYTETLAVDRDMIRVVTGNSKFTGFVKMQQVHSFLFALDQQGCLYQFNLMHLILLNWWSNVSFIDFTVKMPCSLAKQEGWKLCKVFGVSKIPHSNDFRIFVYLLKQMESAIFSTSCTKLLGIVDACESFGDFHFMDMASSSDDGNQLSLNNVSEASPESRLFVLLQHHRYDEAKEFATKFQLDLQPVYQAEASYLIHKLSVMSEADLTQTAFDLFSGCIAKITNVGFVGELCISVHINSLSLTFKLLTLARDYLDSGGRSFRASLTDDAVDDLQLRLKMDRVLDLLVTFRMIYNDDDVSMWPPFRTASLPVEVAKLLAAGNMKAASVICCRHESELVSYLEEDGEKRFKNLLKVVAEDVDTEQLIVWLEHIIPTILSSSIPSSVEVLAEWLYNRAVALEDIYPDKWPNNGLELANVFFSVQRKLSSVGLIREQLSSTYLVLKSKNEKVSKLRLLTSQLQLLTRLRTHYNCNVTLNDFVKETTVTLTFRMLDKVTTPELVARCLESTVRPYMVEHQLDQDEVLLLYIKDILEKDHRSHRGVFRSLRERKVVAIIKCLQDTKVIVESTTVLAMKASIPWSRDVDMLVQKAIEHCESIENKVSFSDLGEESKELYKMWRQQLFHCIYLERVPSITSKYDFSESVHRDDVGHERLVRRLIKQDSQEALLDAVQIARTFTDVPEEKVYIYRINFLIEKERISECVDILDKVPNVALNLVKHTLTRTKILLEETNSMWLSERANHCAATINMMEHFTRTSEKLPLSLILEWKEDLVMLKNIHCLQTKHGEVISLKDYHNQASRDSLLARNIVKHYASKSPTTSTATVIHSSVTDIGDVSTEFSDTSANENKPNTGIDGGGDNKLPSGRQLYQSFGSILHLARLLEVPQKTMQSQIAIQAARKCQGNAALEICKELFYICPSASTASTLLKVALTLLQYLETHPNHIAPLIPDLQEIVCSAATCCHSDQLLDVVALCNLCRLACDLHFATDESTRAVLSKCMTSGPKSHRSHYDYIEWLHDWYSESDVLTLQSTQVFPIVAQFTSCLFSKKGLSLSCMQPLSSYQNKLSKLAELLMKLTLVLNNARRCTMSLQWVIKTQLVIVAHLSNHLGFFKNEASVKKILNVIKDMTKRVNVEVSSCLETLIEKVLLSPRPDVAYAVGLMLDLPSEHVFRILQNIYQSAGKNYSKIAGVAQAGLQISRLLGVSSRIPHYELLLLDAKWAQELTAMKISGDGVTFSSSQSKQKCIMKLMVHPSVTGSLLLNYCKDYKLDCETTLLQYLSVLLDCDALTLQFGNVDSPETCMIQYSHFQSALVPIDQSPSVKFSNKSIGKVDTRNRSWEKIKEELKWITRRFSNKSELVAELERNLRNMCPYDYDRVEFMLRLIESCLPAEEKTPLIDRGIKLVQYLRHVKRSQPPTDFEVRRMWRNDTKKTFSNEDLPKLAQFNLPFHPLLFGDAAQAWKILSNEINENAAQFLAPVAKLIKLSEDKLYMTAAENVVARFTKSDNGKVKLTECFLKKVQSLTEKIDSPRMAVAMAKRIAEALPTGKAKVEAYQWCVSLIPRWRDSTMEQTSDRDVIDNAYRSLVWKCRESDTEMTLSESCLINPTTTKLLSNPTNLIIHLYQDPSIIRRFYEPGDKYPDIHGVVDRITTVHEVDIAKIRLTLILKLLLSTDSDAICANSEDDSTINLEKMRLNELTLAQSKNKKEEDLIRLLYLLTYDNPARQAKYLLKLIGDHKNRSITNSSRVRAFHCLFHIIDDDEKMYKLTNMSVEELKSDLRILVYLTELEAANFKIPVSHLKSSDKSSVARSVIASSTCRHNPLALRAAAEMCREFGSTLPDTWTVLLQQLVTLRQVSYLQQLLPDICRIATVRSLPCIASVWQSCVTLPLVALTSPLDDKQREIALTSYHFLLRCPVLLRIDLTSVAQHFNALEMHALALGCLLLSPGESSNAKNLAKSMRYEILDQLEELATNNGQLLGHILIYNFLSEFE